MEKSIKKRIETVRRGEIPEGYKNAHPYIIPLDWQVKKVGRITTRISRLNKDDKERPAYSINNRKGFVPQSEQFEEGSYQGLDKSAYKVVQKGEFAYNPARVNVGSIGRLRDIDEVIVSSLYVCISVNDEIDGEFFNYWTKTRDFYKETVRNTEGSVREYLFYENFSNMRIPVPRVSEQQKIAEILATCDRVIELKQKLLEEKRRQQQWLMQKLLNPNSGVRLRGYGGKWTQWRLRDIGSFAKGSGISNDECVSGEYPCIKYGDIYISYDEYFIDAVSHTEHDIYDNSPTVNTGTLLFTGSGEDPNEIGKCTVYLGHHPIAVGGDIIIMNPKQRKVYPLFLAYALNTHSAIKQKAYLGQGYSIVHIYSEDIQRINVYVPPTIDEQKHIAEIIRTANVEVCSLEEETAKWQQKKKALLQLLLTGLVRVNA